MKPVTVREFVSIFLRDGSFTFGGGDPTMAALHNDLTRQRGWIGEDDNGLFYALARVTPGTNILAFCAATGWRLLGWTGAALAVSAVTIPAGFAVIWLTQSYEAAKANPWVSAAVGGVIAATVGIMGSAAWGLMKPGVNRARGLGLLWPLGVVALAAGIAQVFAIPPITILAVAAVAGYFRK